MNYCALATRSLLEPPVARAQHLFHDMQQGKRVDEDKLFPECPIDLFGKIGVMAPRDVALAIRKVAEHLDKGEKGA